MEPPMLREDVNSMLLVLNFKLFQQNTELIMKTLNSAINQINIRVKWQWILYKIKERIKI